MKKDIDRISRFDMKKPPKTAKWFLKPVMKMLCEPAIKKYKPVIHYENDVESLEAPFLMLCNHNAFLDFKVANHVLNGKNANYVVAIDGFIGREGLMRQVGCICKRKFTNDITLIKQLKRVIEMKNVAVIYPEARYSLCGTTAVLPASLGKLVKMLGVPLVTLVCLGHHVNSPFWDSSHERGIEHTEARFTQLLTQEEVHSLSVEEINRRIVETFAYDDFAWQKENHLAIDDPNRADGLHKVLYQCPHCRTEYRMESSGDTLRCASCGKSWKMGIYGELEAQKGITEFSHIPDWYEWERENVRKEVEEGTYSSGLLKVKVHSLPNSKKYIPLGEGTLIHDMNGFCVEVKRNGKTVYSMVKDVASLYSCHIEYRYLFKNGDCIDLNTLEDTWYIYPEGEFAVTKMALATEELHAKYQRDKGIVTPKGMM